MATTNLAEESFGSIIEGIGVVLVGLWASWCGPHCRFGPIFEEASGRHNGVIFGKVDTGAEQNLAFALDIQFIPTITAFCAGVLVFRYSGLLNEAQVGNLAKQVREPGPEKFKERMREGSAD